METPVGGQDDCFAKDKSVEQMNCVYENIHDKPKILLEKSLSDSNGVTDVLSHQKHETYMKGSDTSSEIIGTEEKSYEIRKDFINDVEIHECIDSQKHDLTRTNTLSIEDEIARLVGEEVSQGEVKCNEQDNTEDIEKQAKICDYYSDVNTENKQKLENVDPGECIPATSQKPELKEEMAVENREQSENIMDIDTEQVEQENIIDHEEIEDEICDTNPILLCGNKVDLENHDTNVFERLMTDSENSDFQDDYPLLLENPNSLENISVKETENKVLDSTQNSFCEENSAQLIRKESDLVPTENTEQYDITHLVDVKEVRSLHRCSICQYTTQNISTLRRHTSTLHNSKTPRTCQYCYKKFVSKFLLQKHTKKEHSKILRKCPFCAYQVLCNGKFMQRHIVLRHSSMSNPIVHELTKSLASKHNTTKIHKKCEICSYYNKRENMEYHRLMHNLKYVLQCMYCHYIINKKKLYKAHLIDTHKLAKKIYVCSKCFFQSEERELYVGHIAEPHDAHLCSLCDFSTFYAERLYAHTETHNPVVCQKCGYIATSEENLKCHSSSQHNKDFLNAIGNESIESKLKSGFGEICTGADPRNIDLGEENAIEFEEIDRGNQKNSSKEKLLPLSTENLRDAISGIKNRIISIAEASVIFKVPQEYLNFKMREENELVIENNYTEIEEDDNLVFSCRKCEFKTHNRAVICRHISNLHVDNPLHNVFIKKECTEEQHEKEGNTVEFEQINETNATDRFIIEPQNESIEMEVFQEEEETSFECDLCNFITTKFSVMVVHKYKKHGVNDFACPTCDFVSDKGSEIIIHLEAHSQQTLQVQTCPFCLFQTDNQISMKSHVNNVHLEILQKGLRRSSLGEDNNVIEYESLKNTVDEACLVKETLSTQSYLCRMCAYKTSSALSLNHHLRKCHIVKYLKCQLCSYNNCLNLREFWDHLNEHCPQCTFQSSDQSKLKSHMLTHVPRYNNSSHPESPKSSNPSNSSTAGGVGNDSSENSFRLDVAPAQIDIEEKYVNENLKSETSDRKEVKSSEKKPNSNQLKGNSSLKEEIRIIFDDSFESEVNLSISGDESVERNAMKTEMRINSDGPMKSMKVNFKIPRFSGSNEEIDNTDDDKSGKNIHEQEIRLIIDKSSYSSIGKEEFESKTNDSKSSTKNEFKPIRIMKLEPFQCFDCLNVYKCRYSLVDHRKRFHGLKKPHSCTYCMEIFESYSDLKSHYYRVHRVSFHYKGPMFKCPLCDFTCIYLKQTKKHIMKEHQRNVVGFKKGVGIF